MRVRIEGRQLRDLEPMADWYESGQIRADAIRGSQRLLKAILRTQPKIAAGPRRPNRTGQRTWAVRKVILERTKHLLEVAADHFGLTPEQLTGERGKADISRKRQISMYVARVDIGASFPDIGYCFKRDHTTVLHGCRAVELDPEAVPHIEALRERLAA
jgi:hypothetical protein